jgi:ketosteroid isomerase-like protein
MKTRFILLLALALMAKVSMAQDSESKKVEQAVEQLRKAMVDADAASLKKLVADDVSYGHSSGKVEDKAQFIQSLSDGTSDFLKIDLKDQTVRLTGNVAIVRHVLEADMHDKGKDPASIRIGVLQVWTKHSGKWQLLARQAFKLP